MILSLRKVEHMQHDLVPFNADNLVLHISSGNVNVIMEI